MTITIKQYDVTNPSSGLGLTVADVNPTNTSAPNSITYTGDDIKPEPVVKVTTSTGATLTTLTEGTDFEYSYSNNRNVGEATITITGKGNFTGTKTVKFNIVKKDVTITANAQTITYGGAISKTTNDVTITTLGKTETTNHTLTSVTLTQSTTSYTTNGTVTPSSAVIKSGSSDVTSNYNISYAAGTLKIDKKSVAVTWTNTTLTYNNANQKPTASATGVTGETINLTVSGEKKDVGSSYTATATCASVTGGGKDCNNYTLTNTSTTFEINAYNINTTKVTIGNIADQTYTGSKIEPTLPTITATDINQTLINGTDFTYAYTNNLNASEVDGDGVLTITGKGNFTGTKTKTFKIKQATPSKSFTCATLTYNGKERALISTSNYSNAKVYYSTTTKLTSSNYKTAGILFKITDEPKGTNAGSYKIYWYGESTKDNYLEFTDETSCTISKKNLTIAAKAQTITYGGAITTGTSQVTVSGLENNQVLSEIALSASTSNATTNGTITPSAAVIKVSTASNAAETTSNYDITYSTGKLVINPAVCTAPSSPGDKTYKGASYDSDITCPSACSNVSGTQSATNVGEYTQTCTLKSTSNYKWDDNTTAAKSISWKIVAKALTITAKDQTISYGNSIATGTSQVTVSGLATGHALNSINLSASTSDYTTNGTITPSAAVIKSGSTTIDNKNYSIDYKTGKLVINKVDAVCPALTAYTGNYDGNTHSITIGSGLAGGTLQYRTSTSDAWSNTNPSVTNAGTTTVYVQVKGDNNHNDKSCGSKTITINTVVLTAPTNPPEQSYTGRTITSGVTCPTGSTTSGTSSAIAAGTYTQTCTLSNPSGVTNYKWDDNTTGPKTITWVILTPMKCSEGDLVYDPIYGSGSNGFICVKPADSTPVYTCTAGYCSNYNYSYTPTGWRCSVASEDAVEYYGRYYYPRDNGRSATVCVKNVSDCVSGNQGDDYCYDALCDNSSYVCTQSNNTYTYSCTGDKWNGWGLYEKDKTKCFTNATNNTYSLESVNSSNSTGSATRKYSCSFNYSSSSGPNNGWCSSETIYYHTFMSERNTRNYGWTEYDGSCRGWYCSTTFGESNVLARCYAQCSGTCNKTYTYEARLESNQVYSVGGSCVESYGTSPCESAMVYCPYVSSDVRFWDANISMEKFNFESKPSTAVNKLSNLIDKRTVDALSDRAFIKSTLGKHQACLGNAYYNTVCIDRYFWQGEIGTLSTDAGTATRTALSTLLYSAFHGHYDSEQYSVNCTSDAASVYCTVVDLNKDTYYSSPTDHGTYYTPLTSTAGCYADYLGNVYCSDGAYYSYVSAQEGKSWIAKWN